MSDGVPGTGICVMGRRSFGTGIGHITESLCELLARSYDVSLWDLHSPEPSAGVVPLTSGRQVSLATQLDGYAVYVYADVLWNGVGFTAYTRPPSSGFRVAYLAFDSDRLPPEWVAILNEDFDAAYFMVESMIGVARDSGVTIDLGCLPLALDVESLVAKPYRPAGARVRFGTLSAYHPRKGLETLVSAFLREFAGSDDAELVVHSNIAIGPTASAVRSLVEVSGAHNVVLSTEHLPEDGKDALLASFDVYVSASSGEGYSIGPREALALGTCLVATDLGAHQSLFGPAGVFRVGSLYERPAVYPEIDHRRFGNQLVPDPASLRSALRQAAEYVRTEAAEETAAERKRRGGEFSYSALERSYRAVVDPDSTSLRPQVPLSPHAVVAPRAVTVARARAGRHGARLGARKVVVPLHDGGYFSIFNAYASHLVWSMRDSPQRLVLPDWHAGRLLESIAPDRPTSYCYSTPEQGNLWNHLYEPPYDLSPEELDDPEFLAAGAEAPVAYFNQSREPLLTYVHAYRLYHSPDFRRIRRQYAAVLQDHVRLLPHLRAELDGFLSAQRDGRFLVAAHIKHPSHAVEQPDGTIADRHAYVGLVRDVLRRRGIAETGDDWAVFLATEQERVVSLFREEFGDHLVGFGDVERIPTAVDTAYDRLDDARKTADGHQLQHMIAADAARWSPRLAWEVIRDAQVMAEADVLLHAVSNVATAAGLIGPDVEMRFAAP